MRIKTPQWRRERVLEEQASLMEEIDNYFKTWREWRNGDFGSKSSTSIKGAENNEENKQSINQTNQQLNKSTQCQSTSVNFSFSISFEQFQQFSVFYFLVLFKFCQYSRTILFSY